MRVTEHKAKSLHVAVWLHHLDMALHGTSGSLVQSKHVRGPLLGYLLAPGTGNLCFEEVTTRVLREDYEWHERVKQISTSSLHKCNHQRTKFLKELDRLAKKLDAAGDQGIQRETEARMSVIHTALPKVEASITKYEDHLEKSRIREEEACYGTQG